MGAEVPIYVEVRRRMEADRAEAIMRADRVACRVRGLVWGITLFWYALGILMILLSYHLSAPTWAHVALWSGLSACSAGPFFTWVVAYTLGRDHGYWS
jgi:hypothetical protein